VARVEGRERSHTDLEFSDYIRYRASFGEIKAGIESWLREAVIAPFSYIGSVENGEFVAFGQGMVRMAEHGLEERINQVGQERAEADLEGVKLIETWLREVAKDGDVVCLLSPPGSEEEGFGANGQRRLSFTQFGVVKVEGAKREVRMVSIPEKEITISEHIMRINEVWGEYVGEWLRKVKKTDRGLVATPLFIPAMYVGDGLNQYAILQGRQGWQEIEQALENGLSIKEDQKAIKRRKSLINSIAWQVARFVEENNASRLNNIGLVARIVMAREAAGKYLGWEAEKLLAEYSEIESAMWFKKQYSSKTTLQQMGDWVLHGAQAIQAYQIISRLRQQLAVEYDVREMLMGSSCGGGGIGDLWEGNSLGRMVGQGNYLDNLASRALGINDNEKHSESETKMECVTCPFCHKTVDAILTSDKIKCPECKAEVSRS